MNASKAQRIITAKEERIARLQREVEFCEMELADKRKDIEFQKRAIRRIKNSIAKPRRRRVGWRKLLASVMTQEPVHVSVIIRLCSEALNREPEDIRGSVRSALYRYGYVRTATATWKAKGGPMSQQ